MKYCIDKYPKGTYKGQKSDGRYADGYLYENIKHIATKIVDDMTFLGVIFSSTLEVGTGKSVMAQHIGEMYTEQVKQIHGIDLPFDIDNIVFKPKDLIDRALHNDKRIRELPKYSCIILDEWEDAHYWSELGVALRKFFRQCRQLNLFMLVIIPNFFQMGPAYAISRSAFAIDVKFGQGYERGYFDFYNFENKKDLYVKGKKTYNYKCVFPNFDGRFVGGYAVGDQEYRDAKFKAFAEQEETKKPLTYTDAKRITMRELRLKNPEKPIQEWADLFKVAKRTIFEWLGKEMDGQLENESV